jgi:hypothetical protein
LTPRIDRPNLARAQAWRETGLGGYWMAVRQFDEKGTPLERRGFASPGLERAA